ncbi:MAG: Fe-S assembly protein IscX [Planctomyces sp.]|nr:Fe-S assembly protein IscX [Planctomyces sp.]MBA4039323.1 Fe-S assembly protein IscX [Planctomyces sp.]MBA4120191.1 Fe-S assembly protein IscX [Isosphaera sp.]
MAGPRDQFGWLDVEEIALRLHRAHRQTDPLTLRFTALRGLVEALPGFCPDPDHPVNEKILETIQGAWLQERLDGPADED